MNNEKSINRRNTDIPAEISRRHPDARIATKKDFMPRLIVSTIIFIIIFAVCGLLFFRQETSRAETERIMNQNVTVDGVVTKTWKHTRNISKSVSTTHYASYRYFYNRKLYTGTTIMSAGSLSKDQTVTVYIDPDEPSNSRLFHESIFPEIMIAAIIIICIVYFLFLLNKCRLCFQGRMVIYKQKRPNRENDFKTVWKKIK